MENGTHPELLRAVNDRIYNVLWGVDAEVGDFLCECGGTDCVERVELLSIEYAARHGQAILAPGHTQLSPAVSYSPVPAYGCGVGRAAAGRTAGSASKTQPDRSL